MTRESLVERSSSAINSSLSALPSSVETRLARILELSLRPKWLSFSLPSPSFKILPPEIKLIDSTPQFDRLAISSLNIGTVQLSSSTSNTPAHGPEIFSFAMKTDQNRNWDSKKESGKVTDWSFDPPEERRWGKSRWVWLRLMREGLKRYEEVSLFVKFWNFGIIGRNSLGFQVCWCVFVCSCWAFLPIALLQMGKAYPKIWSWTNIHVFFFRKKYNFYPNNVNKTRYLTIFFTTSQLKMVKSFFIFKFVKLFVELRRDNIISTLNLNKCCNFLPFNKYFGLHLSMTLIFSSFSFIICRVKNWTSNFEIDGKKSILFKLGSFLL